MLYIYSLDLKKKDFYYKELKFENMIEVEYSA